MIPERLLIHTGDVVTPAITTNAYNETVRDYGPAATRTTLDKACRLQQDQRAERYQDGRTPIEQVWTLFTNVDGVISAADRFEWADRGLTFEVIGQPEPAYDANGFHHTEATLRILEG